MARVTVEDCLEHVENRFKLVLLASKRTRQLVLGAEALVEWGKRQAYRSGIARDCRKSGQ